MQALAQRTFALLMDRVTAVPSSGDPGRDLIACSVHGYRAFALSTPTSTACSSPPSCHARR